MTGIFKYIQPILGTGLISHTALLDHVPGTSNKRAALIKRAIANGELISLRKGLYFAPAQGARSDIAPADVAQYIYGPSYISFESALSYHGWIPESVHMVMSASQGRSKAFNNLWGRFSYQRIPARIFFEGVERYPSDLFMARPLRALLDLLYVRKKNWRHAADVESDMRIERSQLLGVGRQEFCRYRKVYASRRVLQFIDRLISEVEHEH